MKVCIPPSSESLFRLTLVKKDYNIENSPAESDYSLPCLSSDDAPHLCSAMSVRDSSHVSSINASCDDCDVEDVHDMARKLDVLPPSDAPIPSSPVTPPTSQEHTYTIRPFPLLDLMSSPSFAAIRDMDLEPGE